MLYALDLLRTLQPLPVETHLVVTSGAKQVIPAELTETALELEALAEVVYKDADLGAAVSSGSFRAHGMVVTPCSAANARQGRARPHRQPSVARRARDA